MLYRNISPHKINMVNGPKQPFINKVGIAVLYATSLIFSFLIASSSSLALNIERLEPQEMEIMDSLMKKINPMIDRKIKEGKLALLSWQELTDGLSDPEYMFIKRMRKIKAESLGSTSHYFGENHRYSGLISIGPNKIIKKDGQTIDITVQYLPRDVLEAYNLMMNEMRKDIGKVLLIESGHRSAAYQLYIFMLYMPKHGYSIRETNRFVALPGYSEHGNLKRQAIDFINEEGINGEDNPEEFEVLEEYRWLSANASRFGFYLSYPRNNIHNTAFEPWHWHYEDSNQ